MHHLRHRRRHRRHAITNPRLRVCSVHIWLRRFRKPKYASEKFIIVLRARIRTPEQCRDSEGRVGMLHLAAKNSKRRRGKKSVVATSYSSHNGASHISHTTAENAFSKVHLGHGLVASIGAGEDVAVRSLIVSSGKDPDAPPRASKVPLNPPLSGSRR